MSLSAATDTLPYSFLAFIYILLCTNNDFKIAAINALGDYKCSIEQQHAIDRLLNLCDDYNKDIAVASITSLSKLAKFFTENQ